MIQGKKAILGVFFVLFFFAFGEIILKIETSKIGYRLAQLKEKEISSLKVLQTKRAEYAHLTTKESLKNIVETARLVEKKSKELFEPKEKL